MAHTESGWRGIVPFGLLCAVTGSRWLLEGALPATASTLGSQAVGCVLASLLFGLWQGIASRRKRREHATRRLPSAGVILGTALLVAGPAVGAAISSQRLGPNNATFALALTPVMVAVFLGTAQQSPGNDLAGLLWPGLGGLAGLLLLLPEPRFSGVRPWVALSAMPLITGGGAYLMKQQTADRTTVQPGVNPFGTSLGCGVGALVFVSLRAVEVAKGAVFPIGWSAAWLDGTSAILSLLSLGRLGAARWSAQFLLIPLLALLEGVFLLHPLLDGRSWIGMGLLLFGAVKLLVYRGPERAVTFHL